MLPNYLAPQTFINATSTTLYPNYKFGNAARTKPYGLRVPTSYDVDMSLKKNIKMTEHWNAVFDATAINVTNVVIWGPPASNVGTPSTFGQVTSVANSSRDIQLSLRINY
jgi:hypothetical protein